MLPLVQSKDTVANEYQLFLSELRDAGFSGDIEYSYSSRLAVATDNSIYQKLPQAVVLPKTTDDLQLIGRLASINHQIKFSARGGGTGTNGQSLTSGIVVDLSRYMNQILEINPEQGWVRVQAGLVKDKLNDALRDHGYFFSPDLSTSNRATIGGMINTDASGQGSLVYGKTSDHVLGLTSVLADGTLLQTEKMSVEQQPESMRYQEIVQQVKRSCIDKRDKVLAKFPRLNRFLTGYDLEHAVSDDLSQIDVSRLITGSEGSLCFVAEAKLNLTPIPKFKALVNIKYDSFESALRHAPEMVAAQATSVETIDSKVLNLARNDIIWHSVSEEIKAVPNKDIQGLNMVEYNSENQSEIESKISELAQVLNGSIDANEKGIIGFQVTYDLGAISKIYAMRKKAVGLLGKAEGWKKPIAFAEDTAVPPEKLADFIMEFRQLLDNHGLDYGMFGHVDAGVLHVRPALDMCDPKQEQLMQSISDQVVALVSKYGGLMWGEHGKGYRSEYAPEFFGAELFGQLRRIKSVFDPHNQMNPGKICTPIDSDEDLVKVADVKRGNFDRTIPIEVRNSFAPIMSCNGNGLCFNYDTSSPMCPSSKVTGDRRHSPKGRAGMLREWLRLLSQQGADVDALEKSKGNGFLKRILNSVSRTNASDFSHEVFETMDHCLACKACTNQCPINVDIPTYRARFLALYYQRYLRPLKDYLVAYIEAMAPLMAKAPTFFNLFLKPKWSQSLIKRVLGYVDAPVLSNPPLNARAKALDVDYLEMSSLSGLSASEKSKLIAIVQDPFTSYYEAELVTDLIKLIKKLGYQPVLMPFTGNGKPEHVKGFLKKFEKTALKTSKQLNAVHDAGITMLGIDPSLVLCYRDEYRQTLGDKRGDFEVLLPHEWLTQIEINVKPNGKVKHALLAHCTEKTMLPGSEKQWVGVFSKFGQECQIVSVGCCGMAGTFGHEAKHLDESKGIFDLSWQKALDKNQESKVLATGYSCRSQVARFTSDKPSHPIQALLEVIS